VWIKAADRKPLETIGEAITPTAVQASSADAGVEAINLINRSGLRNRDKDPFEEHGTDPAQMWRSAKGETAGWVEFDLGTVQSVGSLCVFNYNDAWYTDRGVRKADISVWTQETGWKKVRDDQALEQAEGSDDYDDPLFVKLDGVKAQKIRLDDFTSFGDAEFIGLSEVQFFASLGPWAVRPYPADKSAGVHFGELKLTWTAGDGAKAHSLYLGARPDDLKLLGRIEQTGAKIAQLVADTKYFWRVDETGADGSIAPGKVWSFATGGFGGWWKLDETEGTKVADSSGYKRDATIHGDPAWQPAGGRVGGALQFDGIDDCVDTGWSDHLPAWTVTAWIKSPAAPARGAACGPVHRERNFQFSWNHGDPQCRGAAILSVGGTWHSAPFGELKADTWYHLAATYDGENLRSYKDGVLMTDNADPSGEADAESAPLMFGRHATEPKAFFAGTVDDVCVFAYPLSGDEIKSLHSGTEPVVIARRPASGPPTLTSPAVATANLAGPAAPIQPQAQIQPAADSPTQSPASPPPAAAEPQKGRGRNLLAVVVIVLVVGLIAGVSYAGRQKTRASE
jgi:hypothetical protein